MSSGTSVPTGGPPEMGRRNRTPVKSAPAPAEARYTSDADPRPTEEVLAAAKRKFFFLLLAIAAPIIAWTLSWTADQSRRTALRQALPQGVTLESRVPASGDTPAQSLGERLEQIGAWISDGRLVDGNGNPIELREPGTTTPAEAAAAAAPTPPGTPRTQITIIEVPGAGASRSS